MKCCIIRNFIWVLTVCQSTHLGVSVLKGKRLPNNKRAIIVAANHIKVYQEIKNLYAFEVSIISLIMKQYFCESMTL